MNNKKRLLMSLLQGMKYPLALLCVSVVSSVFAEATDLLKEALVPQIKAYFGPTSGVAYAMYIAEAVGGMLMYTKSKNPAVLLGVVVVVIFTAVAFAFINRVAGV